MRKEGKGRYSRIEIPLGVAKSDELVDIYGDYLGVVSITGDGTCLVRLDHRHAPQINLREVQEVSSPFGKIYLETNGAGGMLTLYVGGALTARLKPIQSKVSLRSVKGTDMNSADDKRFLAHTFGSLKPTTMTAANTAQPLIATSTKVKWAIIHTLSKVALIGSSTVTRGDGADDGQKYGEDIYLAVEYVDLNDIYIINYSLGEQCIYSINYAVEKT
jgi:hypothetical protein